MSFSQEIKDFLVGFNTTSDFAMKTQNLATDRQKAKDDKAYRDANLDIDRQKLDLQKQAQGLRNKLALSADGRAAARLSMAKQAQEYKGLGALGTDPAGNVDTATADEPDYGEAEDASLQEIISSNFARGGLVQTAANGAMVGAIPTEEDDAQRKVPAPATAAAVPAEKPAAAPAAVTPASDVPTSAIPDAAPAAPVVPAGAPVPRPREERVKAEQNAKIYAKAGEATELAMRSLKEDAVSSGQPDEALPTGTITKSEFDPASNKGAATAEEIKAIDSKIGGSFDGYTKGAARLAYAYNYFMDNGQIEKAANVAKRILLFDKQAAQTRGYLAQRALEQGDTASATKLIADAYNENIPDGQQLKTALNPDGSVSFSVMKDGKVVQEGKANTEQLWAMAAKVKDGSEFLHRMATLAQTYSPMGSNGAFGKVQTAFVEANADFLALQERYAAASDAEKKSMYADLDKADKARRAAWREAQQVGSKYVKGKNEAEVFKAVNDSLKAAVSAFGGKGAGPAPAAGAEPGQWDTLKGQYATYNQQLTQISEKLAEIGDPNSPEYQQLQARAQPLVAARDKVAAEIKKLAPTIMRGKNDAEVSSAVDADLKSSGGAPAALPMDFSAKSWKSPGGTLPQNAADVEKETALQKRIQNGGVVFRGMQDADVGKIVSVVADQKKDPNAIIGKLIREGIDPRKVVEELKKKGIPVTIDLTGIEELEARRGKSVSVGN